MSLVWFVTCYFLLRLQFVIWCCFLLLMTIPFLLLWLTKLKGGCFCFCNSTPSLTPNTTQTNTLPTTSLLLIFLSLWPPTIANCNCFTHVPSSFFFFLKFIFSISNLRIFYFSLQNVIFYSIFFVIFLILRTVKTS